MTPIKRYLTASKKDGTYYVKRINATGTVVYTATGETFLEAYNDAVSLLPSHYELEAVSPSESNALGDVVPGSDNVVKKLINQIPGEPNV